MAYINLKDYSIMYADLIMILTEENSPDMSQLSKIVDYFNEIETNEPTIIEFITSSLLNGKLLNWEALNYIGDNYNEFKKKESFKRLCEVCKRDTQAPAISKDTMISIIKLEANPDTTTITENMKPWEYMYISLLIKNCARFNLFEEMITIRNCLTKRGSN